MVSLGCFDASDISPGLIVGFRLFWLRFPGIPVPFAILVGVTPFSLKQLLDRSQAIHDLVDLPNSLATLFLDLSTGSLDPFTFFSYHFLDFHPRSKGYISL